ncbi:MAG TPA: calcineurin-like phosphoesterase family protein [Chitinophagaceae bacterium]
MITPSLHPLTKLAGLFLLPLVMHSSLQAQSVATGYVFEDANKNQKKERREKGLPNVAVSNGRDVVLTNSRGRYELPVDSDDIIFVIKPAHYQVALDENNLPRFYYNHKPAGSPGLKFKGVAPTGPLPRSVDFALQPAKESSNFSILAFGDPQARNLVEVDYFKRGVVDEVKGKTNAVFGISLGDQAFNDLEVNEPYKQAIRQLGLPWYNVMGNHDMNFDVQADTLSDETFEAQFGPATYSYNYGNVHFIILDNIIYPGNGKGARYSRGLRPDQLQFIENDLKMVSKDKLIVLAMHIPPDPRIGDPKNEGIQVLFDLLKDFPHSLSLSAHTHIQYQDFYGETEGWKGSKPHHHYNVGTTSGDWYSGELNEQGIPAATMADGTPKGYATINFTGNQYTIDYKVADKPADYHMNIWMPKVVKHGARAGGGLYVNFFMGSENDKVEFRVDDGKWRRMALAKEADPSYAYLVMRWDLSDTLLTGNKPGKPKECRHLWSAGLPNDLEPGTHTVEVRATDMFGRQFIQKKTYEVRVSEEKVVAGR